MKTAIVHDWLMGLGGAERVLEEILELYPSPVFTLFQSKNSCLGDKIQRADVKHSFIQKMPLTETQYRNYLPLYPLAIERFDLKEYDLIISSSHAVAKSVKTHANQLHICYCHTPMRYAWDLEAQYLESMGSFKALAARQVLKFLRKWDLKSVSRVDAFIANSHYVAARIKRFYGREAVVIYPPVSTHLFDLQESKEDFYLTVSRLVSYKRVDLIVEAFNQMPSKKIKIVGTGPEFERLREKARNNIEFLGFQSDEKVRELLAAAKGFIFAAEDDFGIAPLEAQAAGTPVIAYGRGGALETVIKETTGLFFPEQTALSLIKALEEFEKISWNGKLIRSHSEKFGVDRFKKEFKQFVDEKREQFYENRHSCRR
jgi:glycosyltransferase involved in cell wall biosynthesis